MTADVFVHKYDHQDPRLGRNVVHDERSKAFALGGAIDRKAWHDKSIRIIDPRPNPNQTVGNCTMCAKAMQLNSVGNRKLGVVLGMNWAMKTYAWETANDEFPGAYPGQDTGSSGLAAAKTAQHFGVGGTFWWELRGADGIVQQVMDGHVMNVGTRWDNDMFNQDADGRVHPGGGEAGGHEWVVRGYWKSRDWVLGRCWWGGFRDFWIARSDLQVLMADKGDAHRQQRI